MTTLTNIVKAGDFRKLTTDGDRLWVYSLTGGATPEIQIKTNNNTFVPHKQKTGARYKDNFTELLVRNDTGSDITFVIIVGFDDYIDYSV